MRYRAFAGGRAIGPLSTVFSPTFCSRAAAWKRLSMNLASMSAFGAGPAGRAIPQWCRPELGCKGEATVGPPPPEWPMIVGSSS